MMNFGRWIYKRFAPEINGAVVGTAAYVDIKTQLNEISVYLIDFGRRPQSSADDRIRAVASMLLPYAWPGLVKERVGGPHDGGYVMARDQGVKAAISIGVGRDVSWDQALASQGIPVFMFDHTVRKLPATFHLGTFHRLGVGARNSGRIRTLDELRGETPFKMCTNLVLKVDVEGAEWDVLPDCDLSPFRQVILELHDLRRLSAPDGLVQIQGLRNLLRTHMCINIHANNYGGLVRFGAYWFPDVVEATFVRRDLIGHPLTPSEVDCDLDFPCDSRVADISLEGLRSLYSPAS